MNPYQNLRMKKKRMTRNHYLERMAKIISGENVILKVADNSPCYVEMKPRDAMTHNPLPPMIVISNDDKISNKKLGKDDYNGLDVRTIAEELGYDLPKFKLFLQRFYTYHEASHVRYTPSNTRKPKDVAHRHLLNFVEDERIEALTSKAYPPTKKRFDIMNHLLLSTIDMKKQFQPTVDKAVLASLACFVAGRYYHGISSNPPKSRIAQRAVEILEEINRKPRKQYKQTEDYAEELYNLLSGITFEELSEDWGELGEGEGSGTGIKQEIQEEMQNLESDIKDFGIEMVNKELKNDRTMSYKNPALINQLAENLRRIIGSKPSKYDKVDYDGESLDVEGYLEYESSNGTKEVKMFNTPHKIAKPEFLIAMCIDSSGSMAGRQIEIAKKSAINLAYACERAGLYSMILNFQTQAEMNKPFNLPTDESNVGQLSSGGGTNISSGVKMAVDNMRLGVDIPPNSKCAIIVLTDGCEDSAPDVAKMIKDKPFIHMYVIGVNSYIGHYLKALSDNGVSVYGHAEIDDMNKLFPVMRDFIKGFVRHT